MRLIQEAGYRPNRKFRQSAVQLTDVVDLWVTFGMLPAAARGEGRAGVNFPLLTFVAIDLITFVSVGVLAVCTWRNIGQNLTTNEAMNFERYHYLNDGRGGLSNVYDKGYGIMDSDHRQWAQASSVPRSVLTGRTHTCCRCIHNCTHFCKEGFQSNEIDPEKASQSMTPRRRAAFEAHQSYSSRHHG